MNSQDDYMHDKQKKALILLSRIPTLLLVFIFLAIVVGGAFAGYGVYNVLTYDQRMVDAVEVEATLVKITNNYDDESDQIKFTYRYEYEFNGKTHTENEFSYDVRVLNSTKIYKIDSKGKIIHDDGMEKIISGGIFFIIGIVILIYSLFKVRKGEDSFSVFSIFWMMFAAAAIGFLIWGISMLVNGQWGGWLIIFLGCPLWIMAIFLFRWIFND